MASTEVQTKDDLLARDQAHLIHPLHNPAVHENGHVWVRGDGASLYDLDGKEYIDGLSGLWNVFVGHGRKELADAASDQMSTLAYCSGYAGSTNRPAIELAERLSEWAYPNMSGRKCHGYGNRPRVSQLPRNRLSPS